MLFSMVSVSIHVLVPHSLVQASGSLHHLVYCHCASGAHSGYSRIFVLPYELQNHLQTLSMEQTPLYFCWGCIAFMDETEDDWLLYDTKQSFMERWIFCKSVLMCLKRVSGFYLMGFSHFLLSLCPNIFMFLLLLWMEFAMMFPTLIAYGLFVYVNVIVTALLNAFIVCVFFLISWSLHNIMSLAKL